MKHKFAWLSAMTLAVTITSQLESIAATNGMILISTRREHDLSLSTADAYNIMGPGQTSPGDVLMEVVLADHGYSCRYLIDAELGAASSTGDPSTYFFPAADTNFNAMLVIVSGTSGSGNIGAPNTNGIPIIMGEHSCIANGTRAAHNSLFMYNAPNPAATGTDDVKNDEPAQGGSNQFMKVLLPNHPIMQGIPLDTNGMVKIFRDPYPEEGGIPGGAGPVGSHTPPGGKKNYEFAWVAVDASIAAPGTQVIGVLPPPFDGRAVFATADVGAQLADYTTGEPEHPWTVAFGDNLAHQRLVHWFINDQGSGGARRCFNSLTDIGRVIFIRTVKWALGEPLAPYQPLNINISQLSTTTLQLSWTGSAEKNYKILGSTEISAPLFNWQTLKQDIPGVNGTIQKTLDIAAAPQTAFLMVVAVP